MFWDRVAWVYDVFANGINRRANRAMCAAVAAHIGPEDEVLEYACGTGLLTGVIAARRRALTDRRCRRCSHRAACSISNRRCCPTETGMTAGSAARD